MPFLKLGIGNNIWRTVPPSINAHAVGGGLASDLRNDDTRQPYVYQLVSNNAMNRYHVLNKTWCFFTYPFLAGTFGAGAFCTYAPSLSARGTLAAGATTSKITLSTALPTTLGTNCLAHNDAEGAVALKIRVIGNSAGGSGKTEERLITGNTISTTPAITVDPPFSFTPASGDTYEFTTGRVFALGAGTTASGTWWYQDVSLKFYGNLATTNLPATISTDTTGVALDELYVPHNRKPGEGFLVGAGTYDGTTFGCLTATNTAAGTLTGQVSSGDAEVLANEYRNFQLRIVEDTVIPTAVGQRRIIASHTAGASPVYTLGTNWSVTPSTTAKYVLELPNLILLRTTGTIYVYTYNYGYQTANNGTNTINANAWSTTYFANHPGVTAGAGNILIPSWGITPDPNKNARHSHLHFFRGNGNTFSIFDMSDTITGNWTLTASAMGFTVTNTGSCGVYVPATNGGEYAYLNIYTASAVNQIFRYNVKKCTVVPFTPTDNIQAGTAVVGGRMASSVVFDGTEKRTLLMLLSHVSTNMFECVVQT